MTSFSTVDFGTYRLDSAKRLLLRDGEPVPLAPKAFDTLLFLVEHRDRVVSKDELLRALWPDTVVEEASLSQQIFLLRKALGDGSDDAEYIATVPRRGYRFVAPVTEAPSAVLAAPGALMAPVRKRRFLWAVVLAAAVVALAVGVSMRPLTSPPSVTRLAVLAPAGTISWDSPVVSPDGRSVAFRAQSRDGRYLLWVRPFDSLDAVELAGTEGGEFPFWSPDSRWIAFFAHGKLRKIGAAGGFVQILCDASAGRGGTWNRDDVILFAPDPRSVLYRVPGSGGFPVPITSLGKTLVERSHRFPHFLDDGRHFTYVARRNDSPYVIKIGSLDSQGGQDLLNGPLLGEAYAPPGFLVFRRDGTLVAQAFDLSHSRLVGSARPLADYVPGGRVDGHDNFSVSANGVVTYLGGTPPTSELVWFDRRGRRLGTMGPPGDYRQVALSRDESHAAVVRADPVTRNHEIWVIEASRGSMSRATTGPPLADDPVWSPDGRYIAFASTGPSGLGDVHITAWGDASRGEIALVSNGTNNFVHDWSPDGQFILFGREEQPTPIRNYWTVPVSGHRAPTLLLKTGFQKGAARVSPDGHWIAYSSEESGRSEVYVASFPNADVKRQVSTSGGDQPLWRRDGRELFFVATDRKLMASTVSGSGSKIGVPQSLFLLASTASGQPDRWDYAPTSNGERFLINTARDEDRWPINVVFNWTSLLTMR